MKGPVSTSATQRIPVFQNAFETASGGFTLDDSALTAGSTITAGSLIGFDEATRKAKVMKGGVLQANALDSATTYRILKNSNLVVGMTINLAGGTPRAITQIDTNNASYDTLTVGTTIGVAGTAGDLIAVSDIGSTAPKGLLLNDTVVDTDVELDVVIRATVYHRRISPVAATLKAMLPNIIFSESY